MFDPLDLGITNSAILANADMLRPFIAGFAVKARPQDDDFPLPLGKAVVARQYITAPPHERLERFWSAGQSPENIEHWSLPEPLPQHRFLFGIQIRVGERINTRYIQPHYSGASTSPRAILLSCVLVSKSLASWRL